MHCRVCGREKHPGDICTNPDCTRAVSPAYRLTAKIQQPIIATHRHGFHEPASMTYGGKSMFRPMSHNQPVVQDNHTDEPIMQRTVLPGREAAWHIDNDKEAVWQSTVRWWADAHQEQTRYHEQFRGYCFVCQDARQNEETTASQSTYPVQL